MVQRSPDTVEKRAIVDSSDSLDRIEQLMIKLTSSTEKLSKSSEGLERYTKILISLTVLLLFFTAALLIIPLVFTK